MKNQVPLSRNSEPLNHQIIRQVRISVDSLYSSAILESLSVTNSKNSSVDSEEIAKILQKTSEIKEMISARLTAFLYISRRCLELGNFEENTNSISNLKSSLMETLNVCIEKEDKTAETFIKSFIENINKLEIEFLLLNSIFKETQRQIQNADNEELELRTTVTKSGKNINSFMLDSREEKNISCNCVVC